MTHRLSSLAGVVILLAIVAVNPQPAVGAAKADDNHFDAKRVAGSVVYIAIADDQKQTGSGSGFIVAPGIVVTNYHVATAGVRLFVVPNGDTGKNLVKATVLLKSAEHDIAILSAPGLQGRPLTIAAGEPAQGVAVWAFGFPGLADEVSLEQKLVASLTSGTVSRVLSGKTLTGGDASTRLVQHSALIAPGNSGGPLFDGCQRLIAVNTFSVSKGNSSYLYSVASSELPALLARAGVKSAISTAGCGDSPAATTTLPATAGTSEDSVSEQPPAAPPTAEEATETRLRERDRAEAEATRARARAAAARIARDRSIATRDRVTAARQQAVADAAQKAADDLGAYSASLRRQLDEAGDPVDRYLPVGIGAIVVLLLGALVWQARRRRASVRGARERGAALLRAREAQQAAVNEADVILYNPLGSLKLMSADLERGVTVGRSAERADVVLPNDAVSREHARFSRHAGRLYIYDLDSANGVFVNGSRIAPRRESMVDGGDRIGFGEDLVFKLDFKRSDST